MKNPRVVMIAASAGDTSIPYQWYCYDQGRPQPLYASYISLTELGLVGFVRCLIKSRNQKNLKVHLSHAPAAAIARLVLGRSPQYALTLHRDYRHESRRNRILLGFVTRCGIGTLVANSYSTLVSVPDFVRTRQGTQVIYNGVNSCLLQKLRDKHAPVRSQSQRHKLIYLGRLETIKNPAGALRLASRLNEKVPSDLHIVGAGSQEQLLRGMARNLSCEVTFFGSQQYHLAMSRLLDADLVVIPSLSEGYCNVAAEAMYLGKKIIYNRIPTLTEVIGDRGFPVDIEAPDIDGVIKYLAEPRPKPDPEPRHTFAAALAAYDRLFT